MYALWHNEHLIRVARILALLLLAVAIALTALIYLPPRYVEGDFSLRGTEWRMADLNEQIPVSVRLRPEILPLCKQTTPLDVVLLVDTSSSMENAISNARSGVTAFIDVIDFSLHRVALIGFESQPLVLQPLTGEKELIQAQVSNLVADGGTEIVSAVEKAFDLLTGPQARSESDKVLVIMTDAKVDEEDAIQTIEIVKRANIAVFAIGYANADEAILTRIASAPENVNVTQNPDDLERFFVEVARAVSNHAATGMILFEAVDEKNFEVVLPSLNPETTVTNGVIQWEGIDVPYDGMELRYSITPKRYGWFDIASSPSDIVLTDCNDQLHQFLGLIGPRILIMPNWLPWLLLLLLFLLLWGFWRRVTPIPFDPIGTAPNYEKPEFIVDWPKNIPGYIASVGEHIAYPTLIIGFGRTGYSIMQLLKKALLDRGEGQFPKNVKLIWLGYHDDMVDEPILGVGLSAGEMRFVDPKFGDIRERVIRDAETYVHLDWWRNEFSEDTRAGGRMSLFWELEFDRDRRILDDIREAANQLASQFQMDSKVQMFTVGSLSERISASLPDIAHLSREYTGSNIGQALAFLLIPGIDSDQQFAESDVAAQRAAAFRELSRFISGKQQVVRHTNVQEELTHHFLFESIFLYDGRDDRHPEMYEQPECVLDAIADQIMILLERQVASTFWQNQNHDAGPSRVGDARDKYVLVGMIKSFSYWWPVEDIRHVCETRLIKEVLLKPSPESELTDLDAREVALEFLNWRDDDVEQLFYPFYLIERAVENDWPETLPPRPLEYLPSNVVDGFRWKLLLYLNALVDVNCGDAKVSPILGQLRYAQQFLLGLESVLEEAQEILPLYNTNQYPGNRHVADALTRSMPRFLDIVEDGKEQLAYWENEFVLHDEKLSDDSLVFSGQDEAQESDLTLVERINLNYELSRRRLKQIMEYCQQTIYKRVVYKEPDSNAPDLANNYYQQHLLEPQSNRLTGVENLRQRIGWYWDMDRRGQMRLRLLFLGGELRENSDDWKRYLMAYDQVDEAWLAVVHEFTRILSQPIRENHTLSEHLGNIRQDIPRNSDLREEQMPETLSHERGAGVFFEPRRYLSGPQAEIMSRWKKELNDARIQILSGTADPSRLLYWEVHQNLPSDNVKLLRDDRELHYYQDPSLHAFLAEQHACEIERKMGMRNGEMFGARFTRLMTVPYAFDAAMLVYLYGWIKRMRDESDEMKWYIIFGDDQRIPLFTENLEEPRDIEDALQDFVITIPQKTNDDAHPLYTRNCSKTLANLYDAIEAERKRPMSERKEFLESAAEQIDQKLADAGSPFEQDLNRYLKWLIDQELAK
jgi:uncharacterized protein YegL